MATAEYMKAWRKKHPGYHRDWMRRHRGTGLVGRNSMRGMRHILGVAVKLPWLRVTRAQAEREFLSLTERS